MTSLTVRELLPWRGRGRRPKSARGDSRTRWAWESGIDAAPRVLDYASAVCVCNAVAEVPFTQAAFDHAFIVTPICFVADAAPPPC